MLEVAEEPVGEPLGILKKLAELRFEGAHFRVMGVAGAPAQCFGAWCPGMQVRRGHEGECHERPVAMPVPVETPDRNVLVAVEAPPEPQQERPGTAVVVPDVP